MAISGPGCDGSDRVRESSDSPSTNTTALPCGSSPTVTGNRTPRTSEYTPNQEATAHPACNDVKSGGLEKTTGRLQDRWLAGSKKGTGSSERSFLRGNLVPLRLSLLLGFIVIHGVLAWPQAAQLPTNCTEGVLSAVGTGVR